MSVSFITIAAVAIGADVASEAVAEVLDMAGADELTLIEETEAQYAATVFEDADIDAMNEAALAWFTADDEDAYDWDCGNCEACVTGGGCGVAKYNAWIARNRSY